MRQPTIRGPVQIASEDRGDTGFLLEVDIPADATARVVLPLAPDVAPRLRLDGEVVPGTLEEGAAVLDPVGPGRHTVLLGS